MHRPLLASWLCVVTIVGHAVISSTEVLAEPPPLSHVEPIALSRVHLAGLELPKIPLKAHPERAFFQKRLFKGRDLSVFVLSSETADNEIKRFPFDEFVYFIGGRATVRPKAGGQLTFLGGDFIFVPRAFSGTWTNTGGPRHHLELSVIANERKNQKTASRVDRPVQLDRQKLSGIGLDKVSTHLYRSTLFSGPELVITTQAEIDRSVELERLESDLVVGVLVGAIVIETDGMAAQTFWPGDFFVLPAGYLGLWRSMGSATARTVQVTLAR